VSTAFKLAYITPLLKKVDFDPADARSYRPISYQSVLSKLLERVVARQLIDYLKSSNLLPRLQIAYRAHRSTESAVLRVLADILGAVNRGDLAMLTLLICPPLSTQLTTRRSCIVSRCRMASVTRCTDGLFRTSAVDRSLFAVGQHHRFQRPSCSVSRKGRSWDRSSSCCVYSRPDRYS